MKELKSDISVLLNNDVAKNIASLGFFSNYPLLDYYIENNSALIFGKSDHLWAHIISSSPAELSNLLSRHHNITEYYYSVEEWMIPLIEKFGEIDWIMTTNRYILDDNISTKKPEIKIIPIDRSYSLYIYENSDYRKYTSLDYINDRLANDISAGIKLHKKLVAWGFTHDDGALGFLHVLKSHRNKGFAENILNFLISKKQKAGKPAYVNIVSENTHAIKLVEKIGFRFDRRVSWIKLMN